VHAFSLNKIQKGLNVERELVGKKGVRRRKMEDNGRLWGK
jgi:hypothetical protein